MEPDLQSPPRGEFWFVFLEKTTSEELRLEIQKKFGCAFIVIKKV